MSALWYILKLLVLTSWQGFYNPIDPKIDPHLCLDVTYTPAKFDVDWSKETQVIKLTNVWRPARLPAPTTDIPNLITRFHLVDKGRLHDNTCSADFTLPPARWAPMQPATKDPTLDLCTRYPLRLCRSKQCGLQSLPDTSTYDQHWESNPRPSDLVPTPYPFDHMLPVWSWHSCDYTLLTCMVRRDLGSLPCTCNVITSGSSAAHTSRVTASRRT